VLTGPGFSVVLPNGWAAKAPTTTNGVTSYDLKTGDAALFTVVSILSIPSAARGSMGSEDIVALAQASAGPGSLITEPAHAITFAGLGCARLGNESLDGDQNHVLTCRRHGYIYAVGCAAPAGAAARIDAVLDALEARWIWT
jgi:hypothetical protein